MFGPHLSLVFGWNGKIQFSVSVIGHLEIPLNSSITEYLKMLCSVPLNIKMGTSRSMKTFWPVANKIAHNFLRNSSINTQPPPINNVPWPCQYVFPYPLHLDIDEPISRTHSPHVRRPPLLLRRLRRRALKACWISSLSTASNWSLLFLFSSILYLRRDLSCFFPLLTDPRLLSPTALMTGADLAAVYLVGGITWKRRALL